MGIYDRFTGVKLSELTQSQIESVANDVTISSMTSYDLAFIADIQNALVARQGGNAIIQGLGGVSVLPLVDASAVNQTVTANQAWKINSISVTNADINAAVVQLQLTDGTNGSLFFSESVAAASTSIVKMGNEINGELIVSPQQYIQADQDGNSNGVVVGIAYQVKQV